MATVTGDSPSPSTAGALAGVLAFVGFASAAAALFDHLPVAALIGFFAGVGAGLVVPYVLRYREFGEASDVASTGLHRGAVGAAFAATGVVVFALTSIFADPALAVGFGVPLAAVEYLVWSMALPRVPRK